MEFYLIGRVKNKQLEFDSKRELSVFLDNNDGKRFILKEYPKARTLSQNAFYHFYLGVIAKETGDTQNDLHEFFKRKFLQPKIVQAMGQEIKIPASTTRLSKADFGEYMERICAMTGVPIPDPESVKNYLL